MNSLAIVEGIAASNGGIITTFQAEKNNVSRSVLSKLCKNGKIMRIAKGQYIIPNDVQDELYSLSLRSDNIVFSHETALFLHGISDRTPFEHTITVPTNCIPSSVIQNECKLFYIKPELFELGKTTVKTQFGNTVNAYDIERTVCDIIRSRSRIGTETLISALKAYSSMPSKDLNRLYDYAKQLRIASVVRQYMEVLL